MQMQMQMAEKENKKKHKAKKWSNITETEKRNDCDPHPRFKWFESNKFRYKIKESNFTYSIFLLIIL